MSLYSDRLMLRHWSDADAAALFWLASDPAVGPRAGWPPHRSQEESLAVIREVLSGPECYAICDKEQGLLLGCIELMLYPASDKAQSPDECELGFWLGRPYWGRGYATEAAELLIRRAFEDLGMHKILAGYFEGNLRSSRVQERLGFRYDHTEERHYLPLLDEYRDLHISVLTL